jgi:hypothetical protein
LIAPLSDQLPPIFLGSQTAAQGRELLVSEGHLSTTTLARYFDEAGFGSGFDMRRELAGTASAFPAVIHRQIDASLCPRSGPTYCCNVFVVLCIQSPLDGHYTKPAWCHCGSVPAVLIAV